MITTRDEIWLINDDRGTVKNQIGYFRPLASTPIIVYIWCLPYLSTIGFTEANSTSISGFIANAHATGALAALSFRPLNLMWEYQYSIVSRIDQGKGKTVLEWTMASYQFFYGGFLEVMQGIIFENRISDIYDFIADIIGVFIGVFIFIKFPSGVSVNYIKKD